MKIIIENSMQEDIVQDREIDVYIAKLSKENIFLRKMLGLAISEDCSNLIDKKLVENEYMMTNSILDEKESSFIKTGPPFGSLGLDTIQKKGF
jgi:hypothetical protein